MKILKDLTFPLCGFGLGILIGRIVDSLIVLLQTEFENRELRLVELTLKEQASINDNKRRYFSPEHKVVRAHLTKGKAVSESSGKESLARRTRRHGGFLKVA
jgi:hypothetical protein